MNGLPDSLDRLLGTQGDVLDLTVRVVISLCVVAIFAAVFINFISCTRSKEVKREKKSIVATGSMVLFFLFMYALIHMQAGVLPISDASVRTAMAATGLAIVVLGCVVNIMGRLRLGRNWANQATIYNDQNLAVTGVYSLVRHPLYASLIWMFYGASIVYVNAAAFLANTLIFVPFMFHRARLEENLLAREFKEYDEYRKSVGMFFPNPFGRRRPSRQGPTQ